MIRSLLPALLLLFFLFSWSQADEAARKPASVTGTIRKVTLYRDRALVTREIAIPPGETLRSIDVPDLPEQVDSVSVFAEGDNRTIVRAVRVTPHPVVESKNETVQALDQQIAKLMEQGAAAKQALGVVENDLEVLEQLVSFSAVASKTDLNRGLLNPKSLSELATFSMTKRRELAAEQFLHQQQLNVLKEQLSLANRKRSQATTGNQATRYQAKIFVETAKGVAGTVQLNYLVWGCGWSPRYTIRGHVGKPTFSLRYDALVQQLSGEDWNGVNLVLSTASPSIDAARPLLTPLNVVSVSRSELGDEASPFAESPTDMLVEQDTGRLSELLRSLREQQRQAETTADQEGFRETARERDQTLNEFADQMQQVELQAESKSWRMLATDVNENVASQVYAIAQPVSLDTRREQQLVNILDADLAGEMYHVATPLLSSFAYREAQMTNTEPLGLLGGPATIYLDDRFVGRTRISSTASGQRLTIGFGADQQVRTRRELMDKQEIVQGGNRQLKFTYRLVLANFKDQPVTIRLIDRLPAAQETQQLSVQLAEPALPLSDDALYQRMQRPTGLLRWDLSLPKDRHGSNAFDVTFTYTMEFDRGSIPTSRHSLAELQAEYDEMRAPTGGGGFGGGGFGGGGG